MLKKSNAIVKKWKLSHRKGHHQQ